jgi:hypothetical protein
MLLFKSSKGKASNSSWYHCPLYPPPPLPLVSNPPGSGESKFNPLAWMTGCICICCAHGRPSLFQIQTDCRSGRLTCSVRLTLSHSSMSAIIADCRERRSDNSSSENHIVLQRYHLPYGIHRLLVGSWGGGVKSPSGFVNDRI